MKCHKNTEKEVIDFAVNALYGQEWIPTKEVLQNQALILILFVSGKRTRQRRHGTKYVAVIGTISPIGQELLFSQNILDFLLPPILVQKFINEILLIILKNNFSNLNQNG